MATNLSSPVAGGAQTGFTSPTYTIVADQAPDVNAKQFAIVALGGTQVGVNVHSVSSPFVVAFWRPKQLAQLGKPNPVTGLLPSVPKNTYKVVTIKGVLPLAGQPTDRMIIRTEISVPAGADLADLWNVRAALSAHIGSLSQVSAGLGETVSTGSL